MTGDTYMFIDGAHFRKYYIETVAQWFPPQPGLDWNKSIDWTPVKAGSDKSFYYDCVDDQQKLGETEEACKQRVAEQEELFDTIQRQQNTHVRLGSVMGAKKNRRQKKVDILLAVDMLQHGFRHNMRQAILVSGDLDFEPVVKALVEMGIHVHLRGDISHTSRDLILASDSFSPLRLSSYVGYAKEKYRNLVPLPTKNVQPQFEPGAFPVVRQGSIGGTPVRILQNPKRFYAVQESEEGWVVASCHNQEVLERYCTIEFPGCVWE